MRAQSSEHTDLRTQWTAHDPHPHTWYESARLRQLDQPVALARTNLGDDGIGNVCRHLAIHHQPAHTCGPSCIPPARNDQHEGVAGKQQRRALNLAAMTADLLAQPRTVNLKPVEPETVQRETFTIRLDLSAAPKHGAPSALLVITGVAAIAAMLDWRSTFELRIPQLVLDVPMRIPVTGRNTELALQRCHRAVNSTLAPARDAGESIFGSVAKGYPVTWR